MMPITETKEEERRRKNRESQQRYYNAHKDDPEYKEKQRAKVRTIYAANPEYRQNQITRSVERRRKKRADVTNGATTQET